jgi:hypothetical protein
VRVACLSRWRAVLTSPTRPNAWGVLPRWATGGRLVLLAEQSEVVANQEEALEERHGFLVSSGCCI